MIDAKELRINNWVKCQNSKLTENFDGYCQIKAVTKQEEHKWQPTPITEDILVKCGFEEAVYTDGEKYWMKDETDYSPSPYNPHNRGSATWRCYRFSQWDGDWYFSIHESNRGHHFSYQEKVNTLHRFQNLYFALTNEEIIINL